MRSNDVLCLAKPWVELFEDFLLSLFPNMSPDSYNKTNEMH